MPHMSEDRRVPISEVSVTAAPPCPEDKHPMWALVMFCAVFLIVIGLAVQLWPESGEESVRSATGVSASAKQAAEAAWRAWSPCAKPEEIAAVPTTWTRIPIKGTCSWDTAGSSKYGRFLENAGACVTYRATPESGPDIPPQKSGACPEGNLSVHFDPTRPLSRVEVRSEGKTVYLTVRYLKK